VVYGQFRTLINLLLVLALGAVFLWGGFRVFGAFTSSASAPPPATPRPVVQQLPTMTVPPATPTRRAGASTSAKATATPRPTPRPSPTPHTPPKVIVAASEGSSTGATSFKVGTIPLSTTGYPQLYCKVRNSALPPGTTSFTMTWTKDGPDSSAYQYTVQRQPGDFSYGNYISSRLSTPGAYRCDVNINGQPFGSAHFTITP